MISGEFARKRLPVLSLIIAAFAFLAVPQGSMAQDAAGAVAGATSASASATVAAAPAIPAAQTADATAGPAAATGDNFPYYGPDMIKGQPVSGDWTFQPQYTADGRYALGMHDYILVPMMFGISLLVLGLLLFVVARYRRGVNPVPSRTSHNTLIEVIWTLVPVLILVIIAVPSITLLARQYQTPGKAAVTIKATGYQWYWGYTYPDYGGFEVISNMKEEGAAKAAGEPSHLAVDNRMVVPVGTELRIQTTGADVIHSFAIPSLWFKLDAVPGKLNERRMVIEQPGIYYGECTELCGARHGYMPIAIEARPRAEFEQWVRSKGGTVPGDAAGAQAGSAAAAAPAAGAPTVDPAAAPTVQPAN